MVRRTIDLDSLTSDEREGFPPSSVPGWPFNIIERRACAGRRLSAVLGCLLPWGPSKRRCWLFFTKAPDIVAVASSQGADNG